MPCLGFPPTCSTAPDAHSPSSASQRTTYRVRTPGQALSRDGAHSTNTESPLWFLTDRRRGVPAAEAVQNLQLWDSPREGPAHRGHLCQAPPTAMAPPTFLSIWVLHVALATPTDVTPTIILAFCLLTFWATPTTLSLLTALFRPKAWPRLQT